MEGGQTAGDGWGVGWFSEAPGQQPGMVKSILPLWSDENAKTLAPAISSGCFVGHVRQASDDLEVCFTNTPLFLLDDFLFTLNGELKPWPGALARAIRAELEDEAEARLRGVTDAEMLSALWRTYLLRSGNKDVGAALRRRCCARRALALSLDGSIKASVIIAHATGLVAARFGSPKVPGHLYYTAGEKRWPNGVLVASEPLADDAAIPARSARAGAARADLCPRFTARGLGHRHGAVLLRARFYLVSARGFAAAAPARPTDLYAGGHRAVSAFRSALGLRKLPPNAAHRHDKRRGD